MSTTLALIVGVWMVLHGASGLREPSAIGNVDAGGVAVGVAVDSMSESNQPFPLGSGARIGIASTFQTDANHASYRLFFPEDSAGEDFVLLLHDGAIFSDPVQVGGAATTVSHEDCADVGGERPTAYSIAHECQVIYGVVPDLPEPEAMLMDYVTGSACSIEGFTDQIALPSIEVSGDLLHPMLTAADWAHQDISYPSMVADPMAATLREWNGVELDGTFATTIQQACKVSDSPFGTTITDSIPAPTTLGRYSFAWNGEAALYSNGAVATRQDADAVANGLIAVGSLMAGLMLGLVPFSYRRVAASWLSPSPE